MQCVRRSEAPVRDEVGFVSPAQPSRDAEGPLAPNEMLPVGNSRTSTGGKVQVAEIPAAAIAVPRCILTGSDSANGPDNFRESEFAESESGHR